MTVQSDSRDEIETAIDAMTTGGGYNFAWGPVDIFNPAEWVLPQGFLSFPDESGRDNLVVNAYEQDWPLQIRVIVGAVDDVDTDTVCEQVADDLKKCFEMNFDTFRAAGLIEYDYEGFTRTYRRSNLIPAEVAVTFVLRYRQSRRTPSTT